MSFISHMTWIILWWICWRRPLCIGSWGVMPCNLERTWLHSCFNCSQRSKLKSNAFCLGNLIRALQNEWETKRKKEGGGTILFYWTQDIGHRSWEVKVRLQRWTRKTLDTEIGEARRVWPAIVKKNKFCNQDVNVRKTDPVLQTTGDVGARKKDIVDETVMMSMRAVRVCVRLCVSVIWSIVQLWVSRMTMGRVRLVADACEK